jgi:hypothetical protein
LAQAGLPLPLARAQNFQIFTNFRASHAPACAKPPVPVAQPARKGKEKNVHGVFRINIFRIFLADNKLRLCKV